MKDVKGYGINNLVFFVFEFLTQRAQSSQRANNRRLYVFYFAFLKMNNHRQNRRGRSSSLRKAAGQERGRTVFGLKKNNDQ
jgi:hypothetical protein